MIDVSLIDHPAGFGSVGQDGRRFGGLDDDAVQIEFGFRPAIACAVSRCHRSWAASETWRRVLTDPGQERNGCERRTCRAGSPSIRISAASSTACRASSKNFSGSSGSALRFRMCRYRPDDLHCRARKPPSAGPATRGRPVPKAGSAGRPLCRIAVAATRLLLPVGTVRGRRAAGEGHSGDDVRGAGSAALLCEGGPGACEHQAGICDDLQQPTPHVRVVVAEHDRDEHRQPTSPDEPQRARPRASRCRTPVCDGHPPPSKNP